MLVKLVQTVWEKGRLPFKLGWVIKVFIPKGGGDYRGIGLLKLIWKVVEGVMHHQLKVIILNNSIHGCRNGQGAGTAIIETKLTQQLAHIEQAPFYSIILDLKKACDAMDWERCISILERCGVEPNMCHLITISGTRLQMCATPRGTTPLT